MKSIRRALIPALVPAAVALTLVPAAAWAQQVRPHQMILEAEPGTESLAYCDSLHSAATCASVHIETQVALTVGATVQLDGEDFVVDWMGPGYYLETGVVIEPVGKLFADLKGQSWIEVYPEAGKRHTSRGWHDKDRNLALSATDSLALDDGPEVKVKDVRLHLRVSAVAGTKTVQEPERD
jgi:hypothetical protein